MRVKVCKNCEHWDRQYATLTFGVCRKNTLVTHTGINSTADVYKTLDLQTCSAFTYKADADEYPDVRRGGGGGGGDDGPVDITPRGPGGLQIDYRPSTQVTAAELAHKLRVHVGLPITYDPDGDKKD